MQQDLQFFARRRFYTRSLLAQCHRQSPERLFELISVNVVADHA
jgi:hypothetical protein